MMCRLLILFACVCASVKGFKPRIIGGEPITIEDAPYQVSLYDGIHLRHRCGGSIVSPNYILAAAHCMALPVNAYRVRVGSSYKSTGGALHDVLEIIKHEDYHLDEFGVPLNDIALMKITPPIQFDEKTRQAVILPEQNELFTGLDGFLSGWGRQSEKGAGSEQLRGLTVKVFSRENCDKGYTHFEGIRDGQICAGHASGIEDLCDGDSGGPLVVSGRQVGIVSYSGPGCARPDRPGVYTEVSHYRDWIDSHMK